MSAALCAGYFLPFFSLASNLVLMSNAASETNGIPVEIMEPSGYLSWDMVDEANAFDDSEPDDGEVI